MNPVVLYAITLILTISAVFFGYWQEMNDNPVSCSVIAVACITIAFIIYVITSSIP